MTADWVECWYGVYCCYWKMLHHDPMMKMMFGASPFFIDVVFVFVVVVVAFVNGDGMRGQLLGLESIKVQKLWTSLLTDFGRYASFMWIWN